MPRFRWPAIGLTIVLVAACQIPTPIPSPSPSPTPVSIDCGGYAEADCTVVSEAVLSHIGPQGGGAAALALGDYMACAEDWRGSCPPGLLALAYDLAIGVEVVFQDGSTEFYNVVRENPGDAVLIGLPVGS
jgi:hypothetical protein